MPDINTAASGKTKLAWDYCVKLVNYDGSYASPTAPIYTQGGYTSHIRAPQYVRQSDATAYSLGDIISNDPVSANVIPIKFHAARVPGGSGRITGARCTYTTAGPSVASWPSFDLMLFRPDPVGSIPFADGSYPADNANLAGLFTYPAFIQLTGVLSFTYTAWRNSNGSNTTGIGAFGYQAAGFVNRPYAPFSLSTVNVDYILGIMQCQNTWAPGAFAQYFDFALDVDQD